MANNKKTLQFFKDEVAKENGYRDGWAGIIWFNVNEIVDDPGEIDRLNEMAAERYAQYLAGEAWEEGYNSGWHAHQEYEVIPNPYKQKEE